MKRRLLPVLFICISILFASHSFSFAANDIASGVYRNVNWRITSTGELIIGKEGTQQTFSDNTDGSKFPWIEKNTQKIQSVRFAGTVYGNGDMQRMFLNCTNVKSINLTGFDTRNVTNMAAMFATCNSLTSLDVSGFNTSNVSNMMSMFINCSKLTSLDVTGFDTRNVQGMGSMFGACRSLSRLDVSKFDTRNVVNMSGMFSGCSGLSSLNVSGFDTGKVIAMDYMFSNCNGLSNIDISGFDTKSVTVIEGMFNGCSNLKEIDMSSINMNGVGWFSLDGINKEYEGADLIKETNPTIIKTPLYVKDNVALPYIMYDSQGAAYSALPVELSYSVILYKNKPEPINPTPTKPTEPTTPSNPTNPTSPSNPSDPGNGGGSVTPTPKPATNTLFGVNLTKVSKGKKSFTAKWKKASKKQQKQFSGYQIQYSTSPDFSGWVKTKGTSKKSASKVVIRKLKKKTTYYVRMRRYKKSGGGTMYSDWSAVKSVKTK